MPGCQWSTHSEGQSRISPVSGDTTIQTFHDAVITSVARNESVLVLEIQEVSVPTISEDHLESGTLRIEQVTRIEENGVPVDLPTPNFDDGQILKMSQHDGRITLLVEWETYGDRTTHFAGYTIDCAAAIWTKRLL